MAEVEPRPYIYVITPTGNELPDMLDHWKRLSEILGKVVVLSSGISLQGLVEKWSALPNNRMRWCTRVLKLEPYYDFMERIAPTMSYVGLRADEKSRGGMEFPNTMGVTVKFPMQDWGWGLNEVLSYLDKRNITVPFRTDCAACYHQRLGEWWRLWFDHPDLYREAEDLEETVSLKRGRRCTFRNGSRDTWPASLALLRARFEKGDIPPRTERHDDMFGTICRTCTL